MVTLRSHELLYDFGVLSIGIQDRPERLTEGVRQHNFLYASAEILIKVLNRLMHRSERIMLTGSGNENYHGVFPLSQRT